MIIDYKELGVFALCYAVVFIINNSYLPAAFYDFFKKRGPVIHNSSSIQERIEYAWNPYFNAVICNFGFRLVLILLFGFLAEIFSSTILKYVFMSLCLVKIPSVIASSYKGLKNTIKYKFNVKKMYESLVVSSAAQEYKLRQKGASKLWNVLTLGMHGFWVEDDNERQFNREHNKALNYFYNFAKKIFFGGVLVVIFSKIISVYLAPALFVNDYAYLVEQQNLVVQTIMAYFTPAIYSIDQLFGTDYLQQWLFSE